MRFVLVAMLLFGIPSQARAEWQLKPFAGLTFGGGTNLAEDLEHVVGKRKMTMGFTATLLGEVLGAEADLGFGPGFFDGSKPELVVRSTLATVTGNVVVAMPRRLAEYTLRPYFVAGAGVMHGSTTTFAHALELHRNFPAFDIGAGVTGFVSRRIGVSWDVRRFSNLNGEGAKSGSAFGNDFSFWRANMALAIRY